VAHLAEGSWLPSLVWLRTTEELVALEGVAAAHVTGTVVVGAGVANGYSCSSRRYDERVPLLLFLRMEAPRRGGCCLCCYC
jgi:hypothetical protein